jgi:translation initiation factor IF-1
VFDDCIRTHGQVVRSIQEDLYEVTLKNGKPVTAHLSKELKAANTKLNAGDQVYSRASGFVKSEELEIERQQAFQFRLQRPA